MVISRCGVTATVVLVVSAFRRTVVDLALSKAGHYEEESALSNDVNSMSLRSDTGQKDMLRGRTAPSPMVDAITGAG